MFWTALKPGVEASDMSSAALNITSFWKAAYTSGPALANKLFPAVQNYSDGRLVTLIVTACILFLLLLLYMSGFSPNFWNRLDLYTSSYSLTASAAIGRGAAPTFKTAPRTSKFGGFMSLGAIVLAAGLVIESLLQYSDEFWVERSWTAPQVDGVSRQPDRGTVTITLGATRLPGMGASSCFVLPSDNGYFAPVSRFLVVSSTAQLGDPSDPSSTVACTFVLKAPRLTVLQSPYAYLGAAASPTMDQLPLLRIRTDAGYQLTSVAVSVTDAVEGAETSATLSSPLPVNASAANGRLFSSRVLLTPSVFADRTYFDAATAASSTRSGYRAAFTDFAAAPGNAPAAGTLGDSSDTLQLAFPLSGSVMTTERSPRSGILQLLGVLWGLIIGIMVMGKLAYELTEGLFGCVSLDRDATLHCLSCGKRGSALPTRTLPKGRTLALPLDLADGVGFAAADKAPGGGSAGGAAGASSGLTARGGGATASPGLFVLANPIGDASAGAGRDEGSASGDGGSATSATSAGSGFRGPGSRYAGGSPAGLGSGPGAGSRLRRAFSSSGLDMPSLGIGGNSSSVAPAGAGASNSAPPSAGGPGTGTGAGWGGRLKAMLPAGRTNPLSSVPPAAFAPPPPPPPPAAPLSPASASVPQAARNRSSRNITSGGGGGEAGDSGSMSARSAQSGGSSSGPASASASGSASSNAAAGGSSNASRSAATSLTSAPFAPRGAAAAPSAAGGGGGGGGGAGRRGGAGALGTAPSGFSSSAAMAASLAGARARSAGPATGSTSAGAGSSGGSGVANGEDTSASATASSAASSRPLSALAAPSVPPAPIAPTSLASPSASGSRRPLSVGRGEIPPLSRPASGSFSVPIASPLASPASPSTGMFAVAAARLRFDSGRNK